MKVWWCLEHETSGHPPRCWKQLMTHAYGDCRQVEMQLVPADAETDFSLSNSSVVAPGQRLSEHLSQPERSSTEGRQLVPADARMVSGDDLETIAETICRIDNLTGPDVAVGGIPCDVHRSVARAVLADLGVRP